MPSTRTRCSPVTTRYSTRWPPASTPASTKVEGSRSKSAALVSNLDHGGVNGGLKVLVDDVQQNQATQGHGQGYLGALKSLTPETGAGCGHPQWSFQR